MVIFSTYSVRRFLPSQVAVGAFAEKGTMTAPGIAHHLDHSAMQAGKFARPMPPHATGVINRQLTKDERLRSQRYPFPSVC